MYQLLTRPKTESPNFPAYARAREFAPLKQSPSPEEVVRMDASGAGFQAGPIAVVKGGAEIDACCRRVPMKTSQGVAASESRRYVANVAES